jgi:alpha-ketoglutarate-dependent 2,4-dichlorophenoxyacetate dioxygenase
VREHCETRRRGLFVGAHAYRIRDLPETEGAALLEELLQFATQPKFTYSHRWAVYDLVIWDNRRVLHRGRPYDIDHCRRVMHRATIKGRGPTVVDGSVVVA